MNIASLTQEPFARLENRKRTAMRKDVGEAYSKNAQFFQYKKKAVLDELEDLLSGKKEQDHQPALQEAIRDLQDLQRVDEGQVNGASIFPDEKQALAPISTPVASISGVSLEDTIQLLEKVRRSALEPPAPSAQDLLVAASASAKIQQARSQIILHEMAASQIEHELEERKAHEAASFHRGVPSDFQQQPTIGIDREKLDRLRLYEKAVERYSYQVKLSKHGFQVKEPSFYRIA